MEKTMQANAPVQDIQRKARFGHREWLRWRGRDGLHYSAPLSRDVLKNALLNAGTQGKFTMVGANTGCLHSIGWRMGTGMLRNWHFLFNR